MACDTVVHGQSCIMPLLFNPGSVTPIIWALAVRQSVTESNGVMITLSPMTYRAAQDESVGVRFRAKAGL